MRSLWQSIPCIKNPASPLNLNCVCNVGWDLYRMVLWVSVAVGQLVAKIQAVKVGGWSYQKSTRKCERFIWNAWK